MKRDCKIYVIGRKKRTLKGFFQNLRFTEVRQIHITAFLFTLLLFCAGAFLVLVNFGIIL